MCATKFVGMALVLVGPVGEVNRTIQVVAEVEDLRPPVVEVEEVRPVMPHVARTAELGNIHVDALAVDVPHEEIATIPLRPRCPEVHHHARVRMPATGLITASIPGLRAPGAGVVQMLSLNPL